MRRKALVFMFLLVLTPCCSCMVIAKETSVQEKADAAIPITSFSPPEGNTTFLGGTTWCVAVSSKSQIDLQNALDWACGLGMADCRAIQEGGPCFEPDTLVSHASYAFNNYYQKNGNSDIACNFGGTAIVTTRDPSYEKCVYTASESLNARSSAHWLRNEPSRTWLKIVGTLLLLFLTF